MDLTPHIERLQADIAAAAALGDEQTKQLVAALARPTESAARLMLISALSEFAREVEDSTGTGVGVRIEHDRVDVDARDRGTSREDERPDDTPPTFEEMTGDISRVTLRLVEQIKARAEEAAAQNGVSLNSWVAQAVQGALRDHSRSKDRYRDSGGTYGRSARDYFQDLHPDDFRSSNWKKPSARPEDPTTDPGGRSEASEPSAPKADTPDTPDSTGSGDDASPGTRAQDDRAQDDKD